MKKYFELITIPAAFILLLLYNYVAGLFGLYTFTWEMFGKVFVAFLMFLVTLGFVRLVFMFMFPDLYAYFDESFTENQNVWKILTEKQRLLLAVCLFVSFLILFGLILNGL